MVFNETRIYYYDKDNDVMDVFKINSDGITQFEHDFKSNEPNIKANALRPVDIETLQRVCVGYYRFERSALLHPQILYLLQDSDSIIVDGADISLDEEKIEISYGGLEKEIQHGINDSNIAIVVFPAKIGETESIYGLLITNITTETTNKKGIMKYYILKFIRKPKGISDAIKKFEIVQEGELHFERPVFITYGSQDSCLFDGIILVEKDKDKYHFALVLIYSILKSYGFILSNRDGFPIGTIVKINGMDVRNILNNKEINVNEIIFSRTNGITKLRDVLLSFTEEPTIYIFSQPPKSYVFDSRRYSIHLLRFYVDKISCNISVRKDGMPYLSENVRIVIQMLEKIIKDISKELAIINLMNDKLYLYKKLDEFTKILPFKSKTVYSTIS